MLGLLGNLFSSFKTTVIMLVVIATMAGGFYWYFKWSQNELTLLRTNNAKLEVSLQEQKQTIASMTAFQIQQNANILSLQTNLAKTESAKKVLEDKFLKHDLEYLARNKPALIEQIINNATANAFKQIELDTGATAPATSVSIPPPLAGPLK